MNLKRAIRKTVNRFGIDLVRYPLHDPLARTVKLIVDRNVSCVIDVGANDGGFARSIRLLGYQGRIISFEPLHKPFMALSRSASSDDHWDVVRLALGNSDEEVTINVSANDGQSSSVLPMLKTHADAAPESRYVGTEKVRQRRLEELLPELGIPSGSRIFLKIDVQGYERAVLDGADGILRDGTVVGLQLELSLVPLYDGAISYREAIDRAESLGMTLMGLAPVFADPRTGQLLQADAVFFR